MVSKKSAIVCAAAAALLGASAGPLFAADVAGWNAFVIRANGTTSDSPAINDVLYGGVTPAKEFVIAESSQKAGWGTNDLNGKTISEIAHLGIDRLDDPSRFSQGSGPATAPYFNLWVTDGVGDYAAIANEPSDGAFQPLYHNGYDLSYSDLANKVANVYETTGASGPSGTDWVHNLVGNSGQLTFADIANLTIQAPPASYIAAGNGTTGGAPRELGTDAAYGANWIFGDTLSNYVSGDTGYVVSTPVATATPEPASLSLIGLAGLAMLRRRRRQA